MNNWLQCSKCEFEFSKIKFLINSTLFVITKKVSFINASQTSSNSLQIFLHFNSGQTDSAKFVSQFVDQDALIQIVFLGI